MYQFNTKQKDQLFCPKCGASLGIDFRDVLKPEWDGYGISVSGTLPFLLASQSFTRYPEIGATNLELRWERRL